MGHHCPPFSLSLLLSPSLSLSLFLSLTKTHQMLLRWSHLSLRLIDRFCFNAFDDRWTRETDREIQREKEMDGGKEKGRERENKRDTERRDIYDMAISHEDQSVYSLI